MTMDRIHRITTGVVLAVLTAAALGLWRAPGLPQAPKLALVSMLIIIMVVCWALAPEALEVHGDELRIRRRGWSSVQVRRADLSGVDEASVVGGARVFGVGGLFGSYGLFRNTTVRWHWLYACRRGPGLILRRRTGWPLAVVVDDLTALRAALQGW